jgi:hypothetical protein
MEHLLSELQTHLCTTNVRQSAASFVTMQQLSNIIFLTAKYGMFDVILTVHRR